MKIDHIFVRAKRNAPEADLLGEFGLTEGSGNKHPGQGTANRRFFFRNAFIELLWISDKSEAQSDTTRPTMLYERLSDSSASPFGVCFRPAVQGLPIPFPMWEYTPAYLPAGMTIGISKEVALSEPMWFWLEQGKAPDTAPDDRRQPLAHATGFLEITSIVISTPAGNHSTDAARAAVGTGSISLVKGEQHLMEITFDHGLSGLRHDFRPALPLVFNY